MAGTRRRDRWLGPVVKGVIVLNLLDALFTLVWVSTGLAREVNPLMSPLVVEHPVAFVSAKLALVGFGSWLLWRCRARPLAVVAIFLAFIAYYAALLIHVRILVAVISAYVASALITPAPLAEGFSPFLIYRDR